jgi:hypothetical protein
LKNIDQDGFTRELAEGVVTLNLRRRSRPLGGALKSDEQEPRRSVWAGDPPQELM